MSYYIPPSLSDLIYLVFSLFFLLFELEEDFTYSKKKKERKKRNELIYKTEPDSQT